MPITHAHVSAVPDNPSKDVSSGEWNADHVGAPDLVAVLAAGGNAGGQSITNLAAPTNPTDAARLQDLGTSTPVWLGPYEFDFAEYDPDIVGSGYNGIPIPVTLPAGLVVDIAFGLTVTFDNIGGSTLNVMIGDPSNTSAGSLDFANALAVDAGVGNVLQHGSFQSLTGPNSGPLDLATAQTVVFVQYFTDAPTQGHGTVWFEVAAS